MNTENIDSEPNLFSSGILIPRIAVLDLALCGHLLGGVLALSLKQTKEMKGTKLE